MRKILLSLIEVLLIALTACSKQPVLEGESWVDYRLILPDGRQIESRAIKQPGRPYLLAQGDILLPYDATVSGQSLTHTGRIWADRQIVYILDPSLGTTERQIVQDAMAHWVSNTSIRFRQRLSEPGYVRFKKTITTGVCWSNIGYLGIEQEIAVNGCGVKEIIHEIGHTVGLWHEQSRNDRDNYVRILYENIDSNATSNFDKAGTSGQDTGPYDYNSIMHYWGYTFSKNGLPTIQPLDPNRTPDSIGRGTGLTTGDINGAQTLYANAVRPPTIQISSSTSSTVVTYRLSGRVTDDGEVELTSITVTATGSTATGLLTLVGVTNGFDFTQDFTLQQGTNRFVIQARDLAGNTATQTFNVVYIPQPQWQVEPNSLSFSDTVGNGAAPAKSFTVTNSGNGSGTFTVGNIPSWINLNITSKNLSPGQNQAIIVSISGCIIPGLDNAALSISGSGGNTTSVAISRQCVGVESWAFSPTSFTFNDLVGGGSPSPQILSLVNQSTPGIPGRNFTVTSDQSWVSINPANGFLQPGQRADLQISVADCTNTATTNAILNVTVIDYDSRPAAVTRNCNGQPKWSTDKATLGLPVGIVGDGYTPSGSFNLTNSGTATGSFTITSSNPAFSLGISSGSLAPSSSATVQVTAPACTSVGTQSTTLNISGGGNSTNVSVNRQCNPQIPPVPGGMQVAVSSQGRIFAAWNEVAGASEYEFNATFDGQLITVSGKAPTRGGAQAGTVAQFLTSPEAADKQGKQVCLAVRAVNVSGASGYSGYACTTYRYYVLTTQSSILGMNLDELPKIYLHR